MSHSVELLGVVREYACGKSRSATDGLLGSRPQAPPRPSLLQFCTNDRVEPKTVAIDEEPVRASPRALLYVCGMTLLGAGCVSPPRAVGPTTFVGVVPLRTGHLVDASPVPGSAAGPLTLVDPQLSWTGPDGQYQWQVAIRNESQTELQVTVVFELLDAQERSVADDQVNFLLGGGKQYRLAREGTVTRQQRDTATHWQVEYWVRLLPPPERRVRTSDD